MSPASFSPRVAGPGCVRLLRVRSCRSPTSASRACAAPRSERHTGGLPLLAPPSLRLACGNGHAQRRLTVILTPRPCQTRIELERHKSDAYRAQFELTRVRSALEVSRNVYRTHDVVDHKGVLWRQSSVAGIRCHQITMHPARVPLPHSSGGSEGRSRLGGTGCQLLPLWSERGEGGGGGMRSDIAGGG